MSDDDIQRALNEMAKAATADEAMNWLWTAHDRGGTWQECRQAYDRWIERGSQHGKA